MMLAQEETARQREKLGWWLLVAAMLVAGQAVALYWMGHPAIC